MSDWQSTSTVQCSVAGRNVPGNITVMSRRQHALDFWQLCLAPLQTKPLGRGYQGEGGYTQSPTLQ